MGGSLSSSGQVPPRMVGAVPASTEMSTEGSPGMVAAFMRVKLRVGHTMLLIPCPKVDEKLVWIKREAEKRAAWQGVKMSVEKIFYQGAHLEPSNSGCNP